MWHSIMGFRGVATHGKHLDRGQMMRVQGHRKEEEYTTKEGEPATRQVLAMTYIEPC